MGFLRQEYCSGLSFPPPGDLPDPGTELWFPGSPALARRFFTTNTAWEALVRSVGFDKFLPSRTHHASVLQNSVTTLRILCGRCSHSPPPQLLIH